MPLLARLLFEGTGFSLDRIASGEIGSLAELRQVLDELDETDGNVTLTEVGGVSTIDFRMDREIDGAADIDVDVLGGALTLQGRVDIEADVETPPGVRCRLRRLLHRHGGRRRA